MKLSNGITAVTTVVVALFSSNAVATNVRNASTDLDKALPLVSDEFAEVGRSYLDPLLQYFLFMLMLPSSFLFD